MDYKEKIADAILGLAVGDALGVPVEFIDRYTLKTNPVVDMREFGTHHQPAGTWSDDTSMTLATIDGLIHSDRNIPDYEKIMENFKDWFYDGKFAIQGNVFDCGMTCEEAIRKYAREGTKPLACGNPDWRSCGNGSLMRIIPMAFWCHAMYGAEFANNEDAVKAVHSISALTHASFLCRIGCSYYVEYAMELLNGMSKSQALEKSSKDIFSKFNPESDFGRHVLGPYDSIAYNYVDEQPESDIRSTGYVVHSLEAALWCFMTTENYKDCVLKAVNLGDDTDTIAAIAGGLAGLYYGTGGETGIPSRWLNDLRDHKYILELCDAFAMRLENK